MKCNAILLGICISFFFFTMQAGVDADDENKDIDEESYKMNTKIKKLPFVVNTSLIAKEELVTDENLADYTQRMNRRFNPLQLSFANCTSARVSFADKKTFNCLKTLSDDSKRVPLYVSQKEPARIQVSFIREENESLEGSMIIIEHAFEFPIQQNINIFYRDGQDFFLLCSTLETSRYGNVSSCNLKEMNGKNMEFLIESYALEGEAIWEVDAIQLWVQGPEEVVAIEKKNTTPLGKNRGEKENRSLSEEVVKTAGMGLKEKIRTEGFQKNLFLILLIITLSIIFIAKIHNYVSKKKTVIKVQENQIERI